MLSCLNLNFKIFFALKVSDEDLNEETTLLSGEDEKIDDANLSTLLVEEEKEEKSVSEESDTKLDTTDGVESASTTIVAEETNLSDAPATDAAKDSAITEKETEVATDAPVTNGDDLKESVSEEATSADLSDTTIISITNDNGNSNNNNNNGDEIGSTEMSATQDDESSGDTSVSFDPSLGECKKFFIFPLFIVIASQ